MANISGTDQAIETALINYDFFHIRKKTNLVNFGLLTKK